jgi:hypothetical protein
MTLRRLLARAFGIARSGIVGSPTPLGYWRVLPLALVTFAVLVSIVPTQATFAAGLLYWDRSSGPDPNDHSDSYPLGMVLPWVTVKHEWNKAAHRSRWSYNSFDRNRFAMHLALQSLVGVLVMFLWGKTSTRPY